EEGGGASASTSSASTSSAVASAQTATAIAPTSSLASGGQYANGNPSPTTQISSNGGAATSVMSAPHATVTTERPDKVSPLARRLAQEHGIDLNAIQGTGETGRIRKEDILSFIGDQQSQPATATLATAPAPVSAPAPSIDGDQLLTPSPARRLIAEHMVRS